MRAGIVFEPVAPALERIGWQRDAAFVARTIETVPIDVVTADIKLAQGRQDLSRVASALVAKRSEPCMRAIETLPTKRKQRMSRADLDEIVDAGLSQCLHAALKANGIARVIAPIARVGRLRERCTGRRRDPRELRPLCWDGCGDAPEFVHDRLHQRRMECVRHGQRLGSDPQCRKLRDGVGDGVAFTGDDGIARRVHRRDGDAVGIAERCDDRAFVGENGRHRSGAGQGLHQPRALGDQRECILERVDARVIGRGEFPDAVAQHCVGDNAPRPIQLGQSGLHDEQGGLRVRRFMDRIGAVRGSKKHVQERPFQSIAQEYRAAVDDCLEYRLMAVKLRGHARVLGTLPGKQECKPSFSARRDLAHLRRVFLQLVGQRRAQLFDGADGPSKAMREAVPPAAQREADGGELGVGSGPRARHGDVRSTPPTRHSSLPTT